MYEDYEFSEDEVLTEDTLQDAIIEQLQEGYNSSEINFETASFRTYEQAGVMTYNKGFVISWPNGTEFQVTIVQSR